MKSRLLRNALRALALLAVLAVVAYGGFRILSQRKAPSGAREASPIGRPAPAGISELTITCEPAVEGTRGDVFAVGIEGAWGASRAGAGSEKSGPDGGELEALGAQLVRVVDDAGPVGARVVLELPPASPEERSSESVAAEGAAAGAEDFSSRPDLLEWARTTTRALELAAKAGRPVHVAVSVFPQAPERPAGASVGSSVGAPTAASRLVGSVRGLVSFLVGSDPGSPWVKLRRAVREGAGAFSPASLELVVDSPVSDLSSRDANLLAEVARAAKQEGGGIRVSIGLPRMAVDDIGPKEARAVASLLGKDVDGFSLAKRLTQSSSGTVDLRRSAEKAGAGAEAFRSAAGTGSSSVAVTHWVVGGRTAEPTWGGALEVASTLLVMASRGADIVAYPGLGRADAASSGEGRPPAFFSEGSEGRRPTAVYQAWRLLAANMGRELLRTSVTEETEDVASEENETTRPTPGAGERRGERRASSEEGSVQRSPVAGTERSGRPSDLVVSCSRSEGSRTLVVANLGEASVTANVEFEGPEPTGRMTRRVLVAPLDSPDVEVASTEFVATRWFGETFPPYSLVVWTLPRGVS